MESINFSEEIKIKKMDEREKNFVYKLIKKDGQFTNNDLANIWGTKTFPNKFKKLLLDNPPILVLIKARPQTYVLKEKRDKISPIHENLDISNLFKEINNLKSEFYEFKEYTSKDFKALFQEINSLKNEIIIRKSSLILKEFKMDISELEKEIYIIYNQLKSRPHQPIKIEIIWQHLYNKHPGYRWEKFENQILKIDSKIIISKKESLVDIFMIPIIRKNMRM